MLCLFVEIKNERIDGIYYDYERYIPEGITHSGYPVVDRRYISEKHKKSVKERGEFKQRGVHGNEKGVAQIKEITPDIVGYEHDETWYQHPFYPVDIKGFDVVFLHRAVKTDRRQKNKQIDAYPEIDYVIVQKTVKDIILRFEKRKPRRSRDVEYQYQNGRDAVHLVSV